MIINGSDKIKEDGGDYLVLADMLTEGFSVQYQAQTAQEAIERMIQDNGLGCKQTLVKLARVENEGGEMSEKVFSEIIKGNGGNADWHVFSDGRVVSVCITTYVPYLSASLQTPFVADVRALSISLAAAADFLERAQWTEGHQCESI